MSASRLSTALRDGGLVLPDSGRIAVFNPPGQADLAPLDPARLHLIQRFRPDHDALARRGYEVGRDPEGPYGAAVVFIPKARAQARALVAEAAAATGGGLVIVDGQKTDGIEPLIRAIRGRCELGGNQARAHGRLAWFTGGDFSDWAAQDRLVEGGFVTRPGVFSADGPDPGSLALVDALPQRLAGRGADLGAGWGFVAHAVLARAGVEALDLIEADASALDCARRNLHDARARFFWADVARFRPDSGYDFIVANPPFHTGRAGDPDLGRAFIDAAARFLVAKGQLWLVANRHLPYESHLHAAFAEVTQTGATKGFKIIHAARPRRKRT